MKFVKTCDGFFIDVHKIESLRVNVYPADFSVVAWIGQSGYRLKVFDCNPLKEIELKAEAQAWLDNFVAELNAEELK